MSESRTVRVRFAVAVDTNGSWDGVPIGVSPDDDAASEALDLLGSNETPVVHFVTADVPVPEPQEVAGEVEVADG